MTPQLITDYLTVLIPVFDRLVLLLLVVLGWRVAQHIPWLVFFKWLAAPSLGSLVFLSAFCVSAMGVLSQDTAWKYLNCYVLFSLQLLIVSFGGGFTALKALKMTPPNESGKPTTKEN